MKPTFGLPTVITDDVTAMARIEEIAPGFTGHMMAAARRLRKTSPGKPVEVVVPLADSKHRLYQAMYVVGYEDPKENGFALVAYPEGVPWGKLLGGTALGAAVLAQGNPVEVSDAAVLSPSRN